MQTPSTRLAAHLLGEPLEAWVLRHRGDDRSWGWISQKLSDVTGGQVDLSHEWLRRLYGGAAEPSEPNGGDKGAAA